MVSGSSNGKVFQVHISDTYYIEAVERRTFLYTKDEVYMTEKKLYEYEEMFKEAGIIRINKSCLLNLDMLYSIKQLMNSQLEATLLNGEKLIVARTYLKSIKNILKEDTIYTAHRLNLQYNPTADRQPSTFPEASL